MNLTKKTASIIIALALVFTTLVFVSVGAAGVLPIHDTVVSYQGGSLDNAKGATPSYISDGKIGYFSVQDVGYVEQTGNVMVSKSTSDATNLYNFVRNAYGNSATINIDLYAEFDSTLDSETVAAALNFGPGWVTTLKKNTNVTNPTTDHVVDFVNGEKVTLQLSANDIILNSEVNLNADDLSSVAIQIVPKDREKITGTFYYTVPYIEGSQQLSTVEVTKVPVTTIPDDGVNNGSIAIYDSPCKITGYNSSAYANSKFLLGDIGGANEGRFAYIMNSNKDNGNQQIQSQVNFSGFGTLIEQARAQGKSICMDVYSNDFDYKVHKDGGTSAGDKSFCYLLYAFQGGSGFGDMGAKDIMFTRSIKKTLVFTPNMTGTNPSYMNFQFQNYDWSGCTLSNFEFIISAPYLEGSTPTNSAFTPVTTTTTTAYTPSSSTYHEGDPITVYDNGVTYTNADCWNNSSTAAISGVSGAEKKYVHIDSKGSPQQMQGQLTLSGLKELRQRAVSEGKSIYIDVYSNAFANGSNTPGYCDFKVSAGAEWYPPDSNKFTVTSEKKRTFILPLANIGENASSYTFTFMNYSYGDGKSIKGAKFILSVPYLLGDETGSTTVKPSTTTTTTTTTTTEGVSYIEGSNLPITTPTSEATFTGGWGNPNNQVFVANKKAAYITSAAYNGRIQVYNDVSNFGKVVLDALKRNKRVAVDFYGEFIEKGKAQANSTARIKVTFGSDLWFGSKTDGAINGNDESNNAELIKLKNGEVTTQYYDPQKIIDAYRAKSTTTKAASSTDFEVEKLASSGNASHENFTQTDIDPKNAVMHTFTGTTVGQYIEYTIPNQKAGTYKISLSSRDFTNRGVFDVYANGTKIATNLSFVSSSGSSAVYVKHDAGNYTLSDDGNIVVKLVCKQVGTGSSPLYLDCISCVNTSAPTTTTTQASALSDEEIVANLKILWPHIIGGTQSGQTRGRYYMTVPYVEGDNDGTGTITGPTTTTTKSMYTQPEREDGSSMPLSGWDMSKINLDYVDCRIPSYEWVANGSKATAKIDTNRKYITLKSDGTGLTRQAGVKFNINGGSLVKPFSEYLSYAREACSEQGLLAFDVYPDFTVSDGQNYAYLSATIGNTFVWPKDDKAFKMTAGKRYTYYIDPKDIPDSTSQIEIRILNYSYGNGIENNFTFHITAPYLVNPDVAKTTTSTKTTTTTKSQSVTYQYPSNNAGGNTKFYVSNSTVKSGGTVRVPVKIYNNAGLFSAKFSLKFKSKELSLSGVENGDVFDTISVNDSIANDVVEIFAQQRNKDTTTDGTVCYLVFDVETGNMNSEIVFSGTGYLPSNFFNYSGKNVACSFKSGHVIIGNGGSADEIIPDPGSFIPYPTSNSGTTKFTIDTVTDEYNTSNKNKEQLVTVAVSGNAGLSSIKFGIKYDSKQLEYISNSAEFINTVSSVFNKDDYSFTIDDSDEGFLTFIVKSKGSNPVDSKINGKLLQMKFKVKDYRAADFPVIFGGLDYNASNFKNAAGNSVPCSFTSGGIKLVDLSTPTNSNVGNTTLTSVRLTGKTAATVSWTGAANASNYQIFRAIGSSTHFVLVYSGNRTSFTDKLSAGKKYTYKVKALNGTSESTLSNALSVSTMNYKTKAKIKSVKSKKKKTVKVTIKRKIFGAKGYQIQYATNKKFKKAKKVTTKTTAKTIKKMSSKKKYFVRVRSYNLVNGKKTYGKWSAVKSTVVK